AFRVAPAPRFEESLVVGIESRELALDHLTDVLCHVTLDHLGRRTQLPAVLRAGQETPRREIVDHARHEQGVALGPLADHTGEAPRERAARATLAEIVR